VKIINNLEQNECWKKDTNVIGNGITVWKFFVLNVFRGKLFVIALDVEENRGHDSSYSLGRAHDSVLELAEE
jgi:hypothetical protein